MSNFHFGKCVQNTGKNRLVINAICRRFETPCEDKFEKKKRAENCVFLSNFHFGRCLQNVCKNRFEIKAFCICFETLCEDMF